MAAVENLAKLRHTTMDMNCTNPLPNTYFMLPDYPELMQSWNQTLPNTTEQETGGKRILFSPLKTAWINRLRTVCESLPSQKKGDLENIFTEPQRATKYVSKTGGDDRK